MLLFTLSTNWHITEFGKRLKAIGFEFSNHDPYVSARNNLMRTFIEPYSLIQSYIQTATEVHSEKNHLGNLDVDGCITLKWILMHLELKFHLRGS
jgi:hypothetical protein